MFMYVFISPLRGTNGLSLRLQFLIFNLFILFFLILLILTYRVHNTRTAPICFPPLGTFAFAALFLLPLALFHSLFAFFLTPHLLFILSHSFLLNPSPLFLHPSRFSFPPLFFSSSSLLIHPSPVPSPAKISFTLSCVLFVFSNLSSLLLHHHKTCSHPSSSYPHTLHNLCLSFLSLCHTSCLFNSLFQMCFHPSIFLKGKP